jgi:hypothetical protein
MLPSDGRIQLLNCRSQVMLPTLLSVLGPEVRGPPK